MSLAESILVAVILMIIVLALMNRLADAWIRRNIPSPDDHAAANAEKEMFAEFERIRKKHEEARRNAAPRPRDGSTPRTADGSKTPPRKPMRRPFDDCA